jgi:hypothetical protein
MMASYNIFLQRDTDYAETLTFYSDECMSSVIDLTGYTFKAEIKASTSDSTVVETFAIDTSQATSGKIILSLTDTELLAMASGDYFWDLRVTTDAGVVARWVGGTVKVSGTITRL